MVKQVLEKIRIKSYLYYQKVFGIVSLSVTIVFLGHPKLSSDYVNIILVSLKTTRIDYTIKIEYQK